MHETIKSDLKNHLDNSLFYYEVLLCTETSSRSWGYATPNSDHDIFFIFKQAHSAYFTLNTYVDTITFTVDNRTYTGWNIKKAGELLEKSNLSLLEAVYSATYSSNAYVQNPKLVKELIDYCENNYNNFKLLKSSVSILKHHLITDFPKAGKYSKRLKHLIAAFRYMCICEHILNDTPKTRDFTKTFLYDNFVKYDFTDILSSHTNDIILPEKRIAEFCNFLLNKFLQLDELVTLSADATDKKDVAKINTILLGTD